MNGKRRKITLLIPAFALFLLIIDTKTSIIGAKEGMELCFGSVIPSLFPFILITQVLLLCIESIQEKPSTSLKGNLYTFLIGLLGGYPVGAQCVSDLQKKGALSKKQAMCAIGFCNNPGPAFIFGVVGVLFDKKASPWMIWGIQILSALFVAFTVNSNCKVHPAVNTLPQKRSENIIKKSIIIMASICAWVITFRIIISFCQKWIFHFFPEPLSVMFKGMLELTNGIYSLSALKTKGMRFVLCSTMLSFGGICVAAQTKTITQNLGIGVYLYEKAVQAVASFILSYLAQHFLFSSEDIFKLPVYQLLILILIFCIASIILRKKAVAL